MNTVIGYQSIICITICAPNWSPWVNRRCDHIIVLPYLLLLPFEQHRSQHLPLRWSLPGVPDLLSRSQSNVGKITWSLVYVPSIEDIFFMLSFSLIFCSYSMAATSAFFCASGDSVCHVYDGERRHLTNNGPLSLSLCFFLDNLLFLHCYQQLCLLTFPTGGSTSVFKLVVIRARR